MPCVKSPSRKGGLLHSRLPTVAVGNQHCGAPPPPTPSPRGCVVNGLLAKACNTFPVCGDRAGPGSSGEGLEELLDLMGEGAEARGVDGVRTGRVHAEALAGNGIGERYVGTSHPCCVVFLVELAPCVIVREGTRNEWG